MIQNAFLNALVVNLSLGCLGDTHYALNWAFCSRASFLLPMTRDICINKAYRELLK